MSLKWVKRLAVSGLVLVGLAVGYVVLEDRARTTARAELERQMHARFETLLCEGPVEGNVCLAHPGEGRCLTGEYIDYRTVWGYPQGEADVRSKIRENYEKFGEPQKFLNWLACQGFAHLDNRETVYRKNVSTDEYALILSYTVDYVDGFSIWDRIEGNWPISILGNRSELVSLWIDLKNKKIKNIGFTNNKALN